MGLEHLWALYVDYETRSRADLDSVGVAEYSKDPTTEILYLCYTLNDGPVQIWHPGEPVPAIFFDPRVFFFAVNAEFEIEITRNIASVLYGFPVLPDSRWVCVSSMAANAGLAQGLAKMSAALELGEESKDHSARLNMLRLCKPVGGKLNERTGRFEGGEFDNDAERHDRNRAYCGQDVIAERAAAKQLPLLTERERRVWLLHRKINSRGVPIDADLCRGANAIVEEYQAGLVHELGELTDQEITTPDQRDRMIALAERRGVDLRLPGDDKPNVRKETVERLLPMVEDPIVKRMLEIRQLLGSAAIDKFRKMLTWAAPDGCIYDALTYFGAGPGRWSGRGPQVQNLFRPKHSEEVIEEAIPLVMRGDLQAIIELSRSVHRDGREDVFGLLSSIVRSTVKAPPGKKFIISDFSGVEARVLAWLANAERLLTLFRNGEDVYVAMAQDIFQCGPDEIVDPETKKPANPEQKRRRQMGKVPFLGAGYQMGWEHLMVVADKQAGVTLTEMESRNIVDTFRGNNPEIPQFWRDIENAAKWVVSNGKPIVHPKFAFRMFGRWLVMRLPSGRELFYRDPRFEPSERRSGMQLVYSSPKGKKQLYGGLLTENIDQASSRDLLVDAMFRMDAMGIDMRMTVHDETVSLCDENDDVTPALVHSLMETVGGWSHDIPITAETHTCVRYAK